ncbi:MAG: hypothetical protein GVY36_17160 [Verrucomicrobia bacterium]|jgi:hypothetical protein|nr:hypothetical protein [Verrucomicrobiota bacterium]
MYQSVRTKAPIGRKLLLLLVLILIVGSVISGTHQIASVSDKAEAELVAEKTDSVQDHVGNSGTNPGDVAEADDPEVKEQEEEKVADVTEINERVVLGAQEDKSPEMTDLEADEAAKSPVEGQEIAINRITMVEQPDLSDIFQVTEYIKGLKVTATTGSKVAINGEVFHSGDYIESSQAIKFVGQDESGALVFEAHQKRLKLRL